MKIGSTITGVIVACLFIYGAYWIVKNVSYAIFYESLVEETICAEVKPQFLINPTNCE